MLDQFGPFKVMEWLLVVDCWTLLIVVDCC